MNLSNNYIFNIQIQYPNSPKIKGINFEIPGIHREFKPCKTIDSTIPISFAIANGEIYEEHTEIVHKDRKILAKKISEEIVECLINLMRENDTYNGYTI